MAGNTTDWRLVIAPNRTRKLIVVVLIWIICILVAWMVSFALPSGTPGWVAWAPLAAFALVVAFYGVKTSLTGSGTVTLTEESFMVSDGKSGRVRRR